MFQMAFDVKTTVNSIGIILNIIGVWCVLKYSPINEHTIDGGEFDDDPSANKNKVLDRNKKLRDSVVVVIIGSFLQLCSNYIMTASVESTHDANVTIKQTIILK
jgi:hypothetical protein